MSKTLKMCEISDVWGLSRLSYRCQIYFKLRKLTRIGLLQPILLLKRNNNSPILAKNGGFFLRYYRCRKKKMIFIFFDAASGTLKTKGFKTWRFQIRNKICTDV